MSINLNITAQTDIQTGYTPFPSGVVNTILYQPPAEPNTEFRGCVFAPNKKIYFIPNGNNTDYVLVYDTINRVFSRIPGVIAGNFFFAGGVLAKNGKIYCVPASSTYVLIIDTKTDTVDTTSITGIAGGGKWIGGCLAPNDKIYLSPQNIGSVGIIDPSTDTIDTTTITGITGEYATVHLAENGNLYFVPGRSTDNVLIVDPTNDTSDDVTISGIPGVVPEWLRGGALAKNGKIYCTPSTSTFVLIIDPSNNTVDTTSITGLAGTAKFRAGVTGLDGFVYFGPSLATTIAKINVDTDTIDLSIATPGMLVNQTSGLCNDDKGIIYFAPGASLDTIYTLNTGVPAVPVKWATSAYVNKF